MEDGLSSLPMYKNREGRFLPVLPLAYITQASKVKLQARFIFQSQPPPADITDWPSIYRTEKEREDNK